MEMPLRATCAQINLERLRNNFRNIKNRVGDKKICSVVKADAYGHGFSCIEALIQEGTDYLAVAFLEEGIVIREQTDAEIPIMLLGHTFEDRCRELIEYKIEPTVYQYDFAKALSEEAVRAQTTVPVHIKIETGMGRIGIDWKEAAREIQRISQLPGIEIKGIFTHFATADEADKTFTQTQLDRFNQVLAELKDLGISIPIRHIDNSAGIMDFDHRDFDMVRPGIILYGHYPSEEVNKENLEVKPVMTFKTRVTHIKDLEPGESVGYGRTFMATEPRRVATLPVGYADGYSRILSHKNTDVYIHGKRAPVLGNICMDQTVIDITDIPEVRIGDEVELFGDHITAEEIAEKLGTISYEVTCMINKRVPRDYIN